MILNIACVEEIFVFVFCLKCIHIVLNLSGLIKTFNGANWAQFENIAFTNHVLEIVKQNCPNVTTIDLKDNNIGTLQPFNRLHFFAPNVQNLCLSDNNFRYMSELNHLEGLKHNLRELILPQQNLVRVLIILAQTYLFFRFEFVVFLTFFLLLLVFVLNIVTLECCFLKQKA